MKCFLFLAIAVVASYETACPAEEPTSSLQISVIDYTHAGERVLFSSLELDFRKDGAVRWLYCGSGEITNGVMPFAFTDAQKYFDALLASAAAHPTTSSPKSTGRLDTLLKIDGDKFPTTRSIDLVVFRKNGIVKQLSSIGPDVRSAYSPNLQISEICDAVTSGNRKKQAGCWYFLNAHEESTSEAVGHDPAQLDGESRSQKNRE